MRICGADRTTLFTTAYIHATSQFSDSSSYTKSPSHSTKIHTHTGKRIGIDYAEEAVDFPWRFWLERIE